MESPAFFSTLLVWKMPEKPPKAVAAAIRTAAGKPGTLAAMAWMPVVISTDAHFAAKIGQADWAFEMLESVGYPKELILNRDLETFERYLASRPRMRG